MDSRFIVREQVAGGFIHDIPHGLSDPTETEYLTGNYGFTFVTVVKFPTVGAVMRASLLLTETFYRRWGKRWFDAAASAAGIVLLSPLLIGIAIAVRLKSAGPIFFRQVRTGRSGRPFRIFKFRTMINGGAERGDLITAGDDSRITALGRMLRKTKIDELPQLINVLLGEMSLVGPRPEIPEFTKHYAEKYRGVLLARPGITGPAASAYVREEEILAGRADSQNFYTAEILPRKLELDLRYCEDIRFANDAKLIFQTFARILATLRPAGTRPKNRPACRPALRVP